MTFATTISDKKSKSLLFSTLSGVFNRGALIKWPTIFTEKVAKKPASTDVEGSELIPEETLRILVRGLEKLRTENGVFIAAPSDEYRACWIRDQLYSTLAYRSLGDEKKYTEGIRVVFNILHGSRQKIENAICHPPKVGKDYIHAKFHHEHFGEITDEWGHHQIDAIGLFLFLVGVSEREGKSLIRDKRDADLIRLLVWYLLSVRYFEIPDNGMWEEGPDLHTSSIGAAVAGLTLVRDTGLADVPDSLITNGMQALFTLLPNESPDRDVDLAQLSLLWPYDMLPKEIENVILERVHARLVRDNGLQRYWDDNYYRSDNGISAEWTFGFFWLSIVYSKRGEYEKAREWFERGILTMTPEGDLPELYQNGKPNGNTPLAWSHSMAIIAAKKLK